MKFTQLDAIRVYREYCLENGWAFAPVPQALYCVAEAAVKAERVAVSRSLARLWEHAGRKWWAKLDAAMDVLSGLSSYLGAGLGEDATTPEQYDERIRWGIDAMMRHQTSIADGYKQQMVFECATRDEKIGRLEKELGQVQELYDLIGSIRSPEEKVSPTVPEAAIADLQEVGWELERLREQCKTAGPAMTDEEKSLAERAMFVAMNARSTAHEVLVNDAVVVATFAQRMLESRNSWRRVAATSSAAQERRRCATICDVIAGKLERDGMVQSASHVRGCAAKIRCQDGDT